MILRRIVYAMLGPFQMIPPGVRREPKIGGQAVIEGVMMRSPRRVSWAVRKPDGQVVIERIDAHLLSQRHKVLGGVVIRGAVALFEQVYWGVKALNRSAELASAVERKTDGVRSRLANALANILTFAVALVISVALFLYLPMVALTALGLEKSALVFNLLAGILRVAVFLCYLGALSLWKDVRRLFEYHGAEHKAIFAYEDGKELTVENMRTYSTHHPRCGTSFIILVTAVCIVLFAFVDAMMIRTLFSRSYPISTRLLVHFILIPFVGGISYELLKMADRYRTNRLVSWLIAPGLWLQRITTHQPDDGQLVVAAKALEAAL